MKCTVHGEGLYAWVTAVRLSQAGHHVTLLGDMEPDNEVMHEPDLMAQAAEEQLSGRFTRYTGISRTSDEVHWLALDGGSDVLTWRAAGILQATEGDLTLICLSTTPVGSLELLQQRLRRLAPRRRIVLLAMPLFIRNGCGLADFSRPPLLLIGESEPGAGRVLLDWLRPYSRQAGDTLIVPLAAAELTKFGVNAMLATRISLMNELASLAERVNVDIDQVRQGMSADPRIGAAYLEPGCGFGGPSFTDQLFDFARALREAGGQPGLLDAVLRINAEQRDKPFRMLWRHFQGQLSGLKVAIWGAAYKPDTASVDHSPVHPLLRALLAHGVRVSIYDPMAMDSLKSVCSEGGMAVECATSAVQAAEGADAVVLLTAWSEFHNPDFPLLRQLMRQPVIIDGRNIYDPVNLREQGFVYHGIGRSGAMHASA